MKKITKRLVSVMLAFAIVLAGMVIPSDAVKAATKGEYFGFNTYEDWAESMGLGAGASKKSVNDLSSWPSGVNENGEFTYNTYAELAASIGFVIPTDCSEILVDAGGTTYVGYKSDGSKFIIVKSDGYDNFGYDKNGYNRWGYDIRGYDRNGYDSDGYDKNGNDKNGKSCVDIKLNVTQNKKGNKVTKTEEVVTFKKEKVTKEHYTISIKKNVNKNGFGEYRFTVNFDDKYKNIKFEKSIVVTPKIVDKYDNSRSEADDDAEWDFMRPTFVDLNINDVTWRPMMSELLVYHTKNLKQKYDGIQIMASSKKNGKGKVYFKKNYKWKDGYLIGHVFNYSEGCAYKVGNYKKAKYITFRFYVTVDGKKYYSDMHNIWAENMKIIRDFY